MTLRAYCSAIYRPRLYTVKSDLPVIWIQSIVATSTKDSDGDIVPYHTHILTLPFPTHLRLTSKVFRNIAPCSLVQIKRRFNGAYHLHHQGNDLKYHNTSIPFSEYNTPSHFNFTFYLNSVNYSGCKTLNGGRTENDEVGQIWKWLQPDFKHCTRVPLKGLRKNTKPEVSAAKLQNKIQNHNLPNVNGEC